MAEAYVCLHYGTGFVWLRSATPAEYAARHHAGERARAVRDRDSGRVRQSDLGIYPSDASPDAAHPRGCLHFTPTCTSWLNQVALWIAKSEREAIAHGISRRRPTSGANSSNKSGCATNPVSRFGGRTAIPSTTFVQPEFHLQSTTSPECQVFGNRGLSGGLLKSFAVPRSNSGRATPSSDSFERHGEAHST